jgi:lipoprotein NlpD
MIAERVRVLAAATAVVAMLGCVQRTPAPVDDRSAPRAAVKPAAPAPQALPPDTYVVKRGDTLYSIALDQGVDWRELAALNQLSDPTKLQTGQVLRVRPAAPAAAGEGVVVSPIDAGQPIAARPLGADAPAATAPPGPPAASTPVAPRALGLKTEPKGVRLPYSDENLAAVLRSEAARAAPKPETETAAPKPEPPATTKPEATAAAKPEPPAAVKPEPPAAAPKPEPDAAGERVDWMWPATGKVVATFNGTASKGVDIAGRVGDPVFASAAGRVVYSGEGIPAYGKLVIIRHNSTYLSAYAHNSQILVKEGQNVARGQKIAEVGTSGAKEAKLHFEIRRLGKPVDPLAYLPSRPN